MTTADPFFEPYNRDDIAYGDQPSAPLAAYLKQARGSGLAFDLAAGAGRDTLALAQAGYDVTAIDLSPRGLERIVERAGAAGLEEKVTTVVSDIREVDFPTATLSGLVATTMLDHIPALDAEPLWQKLCDSLAEDGFMYIEVHTTEDPASPVEPGKSIDAPVSETAGAVVNYFAPNQLIGWALRPESNLRVLQYAERQEWDYTHGPEHLHGKAILLAVRTGSHPTWYGQPAAFPRRED